MNKKERQGITRTLLEKDPNFTLFKAVAVDVFNREMKKLEKKPNRSRNFVVAVKAHKDMPALWIDVEDTQKFLNSKQAQKYFDIKL